MILLDTNVVSELMRPVPAPQVLSWFAGQAAGDLYLSALSEAELCLGVAHLPGGRRRDRIAAAVEAMLDEDFEGRILAFDRIAARHYAALVQARRQAGRPIQAFDAQIAATALSHGFRLATRNTADFEGTGVALTDPWAG